MPHKIAAYLRVSTEEQAIAIEGSLDNQKYRLKCFVDAKNMQEKSWGKIVDFYIDDGFSAKDTNRPAYQRMMLDLKNKKIDLILVPDLSRLSRNLLDFCNLLDLLETYTAGFLSIKEQFDTSTSIGRMMIYQIINLAQFEREQTSERVALGVYARAMRGLLNGGRPILGYDKHSSKPGTYIINEDEAIKVRKIFETYIQEGSRAKTIKKITELGILPKINKHFKKQKQNPHWTVESLGYLLSNAVYIGYHEVNKKKKHLDQDKLKANQKYQLVKASWKPIVDENLFYKVQDQLDISKTIERTRLEEADSRVYLLTGIFKCSECGESLVGQSYHGYSSVYKYYGHTTRGSKHGCNIQRVNAEEVENVVIKYLKDVIGNDDYFNSLKIKLSEISMSSKNSLESELRSLKIELENINIESSNIFKIQTAASFGSEVISLISDRLEEVAKRKVKIQELIKLVEAKLENCNNTNDSVITLRK
ncbi:MAG: recombinase family protein, partial [Bdellovibrionales bacterium]|nr:recombinase family protein [Bdellovibrionales bacterium]